MHKLDWHPGEDWIPHSHPRHFAAETLSPETNRLRVGVPSGETAVVLNLARCLTPPFYLLYVLHTPRGEGEAGRYQSPQLSLEDVEAFISRFADFLTGDGRFDFWLHSPASEGTLMWDRHDLLYAYGPIEGFREELIQGGYAPGQPHIPTPHRHHYRPEFDADARALLATYPWRYSPLRPEDEQ